MTVSRNGTFRIFAGMNRWLKILVVCILMLSCRVLAIQASCSNAVSQPGGEIRQDNKSIPQEVKTHDFCLYGSPCEYAPAEHFSPSARLRSSGSRRSTGNIKIFIKSGNVVNIAALQGFIPERSRFVSGTLSPTSHFILLRKFRL